MELAANHITMLLSLAATGAFSGILAGLLGVGGGIVIVPVLFFLFQSYGVSPASAMTIAAATSLATIVPTSISSVRAHEQKGNVDFGLLRRWAPFTLVGVLLGSWLVTQIDGTWLAALFGLIATLTALNMLFRSREAPKSLKFPSGISQSLMGALIGFLSVMVGIGGGTLSVPLLTLYDFPMRKAVGTSAAIGLIISLPGTIILLVFGVLPADAPVGTFGLVNVIGFLSIAPLSVFFAPVGASLANKMNPVKLKRVFDVALLCTGLRMLMQVSL